MPVRPDRRVTAAFGIAALVVSPLAALVFAPGASADVPNAPVPVCAGPTCTVTFGYTGGTQTFAVPADVTSVRADVSGASGGGDRGGHGGTTTATVPVTPGSQLTVAVGQQGAENRTTPTYGGGGPIDPSGAGGYASSGGGGSFVYTATDLLVAGGGGGGHSVYAFCGRTEGGSGGGATGGTGDPCVQDGFYFYDGGTGGTQSAGGQGGQFNIYSPGSYPGTTRGTDGTGPASGPTAAGQGGTGGGSDSDPSGVGGGGGGGYFGGGGGAYLQGGGGGSGFASSAATDVVSDVVDHEGNGSISITYARFNVPQQLQLATTAGSTGYVGYSHTLTVSGGESTSPVNVQVTDSTGCHLGPVTHSVDGFVQQANATITLDAIGTCKLTVTQAGDAHFVAATPADLSIDVVAQPTEVYLDVPTTSVTYGAPLSALVYTSPGVAGTIHVTRTTDSGPVTVLDKDIAAGDGDTAVTLALPAGVNQLSSRFVPDDLIRRAESSQDVAATVTVTPASSSTALRVTKTHVVATVTAQAPSTAVPTGNVQFALGSTPLGDPVALVDGTATLTYRVPAGRAHELSATYLGQGTDAETAVTGSVATAARQNPSITARVTSAAHKSRSGWYAGPVTVRFTCVAGSAAVTRCPAPITVTHEGMRTITRSIASDDGGAAVRSVTVKIDRSRPTVAVRGVRAGRVYDALPNTACRASDTVSGIASCRVVRHVHGDRVAYRATAVDLAGHTRSVRVVVLHPRVRMVGAQYGGTRPVVRNGRTYTLVVTGTTRPSYVNAAPAPRAPKGDGGHFTKAGRNRWVYVVTFYRSKSHSLWNFGVRIGHRTTVTTVRIR